MKILICLCGICVIAMHGALYNSTRTVAEADVSCAVIAVEWVAASDVEV